MAEYPVIPAHAGIQVFDFAGTTWIKWITRFALLSGMRRNDGFSWFRASVF